MMGRSLALDIGDRRIGVAVSDPLGISCRPLTTLTQARPRADGPVVDPDTVRAVVELVARHEAQRVVAGDPRMPSGDRGEQALAADAFVAALQAALDEAYGKGRLTVERWDESYTTETARERLRQRGEDPRRAKESGLLDAEAAAIILEEWLRSQDRPSAALPT